MKDADLILKHLYQLAMTHEEQYQFEVDEGRKGYLVGVAKGLLLATEIIEEVTGIEVRFIGPYTKEEDSNEDT